MSIQHPGMQGRRGAQGFTLLELVIVVAIIAILVAIALPSYTNYVVKTNRAAAESCLSQDASYMERYYTTNLNYAADSSNTANTLPTLDCTTAAQTGNNYQYGFAPASPTSSAYTIQATPIGTQLARDTQCGTLALDEKGARTNSGPGTLAQCWGG
ncbi:MAG TPA: type IV pilin protein [Rhodanobacter sp.]